MKSFTLIVAAVLAFDAYAQRQGSITGVVRDESGLDLPGVTVEITAQNFVAQPRTATTDRQGRYAFAGLQAGSYSLRFRLAGFATVTESPIPSSGLSATSLDVVMRLGPRGQAVPLPGFRIPSPPPRSDAGPGCLHGVNETAAERERRLEALAAMRLIYGLLERVPVNERGFPDWVTLSRSKAVADLKGVNVLAMKIQWGTSEPLSGWRLRYEAGLANVAFALTDARDPCGFTYSSRDPDVFPPIARDLPLSPS